MLIEASRSGATALLREQRLPVAALALLREPARTELERLQRLMHTRPTGGLPIAVQAHCECGVRADRLAFIARQRPRAMLGGDVPHGVDHAPHRFAARLAAAVRRGLHPRVELDDAGKQVQVLYGKTLTSCTHKGDVTVSVKHKVGLYRRNVS